MGERTPLWRRCLLDQGRYQPEGTGGYQTSGEEAWSPLLRAGTFFVPRYGPGNVIQWGWSKGKTSKIMIKGGARGVIWLVEISPAFGVTTRGRRGGCPFSLFLSSLLSLRLLSLSHPDAQRCLCLCGLSPSSHRFPLPHLRRRCRRRADTLFVSLSRLRLVPSFYPSSRT